MSEQKTPPTPEQTPKPDKPADAKAGTATEPKQAADKPAPGAGAKPTGKGGKPGEPPAGKKPNRQTDKSGNALGGTLAFLALLLALGAGGASYVLWQQLQQMQQTDSGLRQRLSSLETDSKDQAAALQDTEDKLRDEFGGQFQDLSKGEDALRKQLQETVFNLKTQLGAEQKDWEVAEAEYLLRIANRRLQLERDAKTAVVALAMADGDLARHGDPAYLPVRREIAKEVEALHAEAGADLPSLSLRLSGVISEVGKLPLADNASTRSSELKQRQGEGESKVSQASSWRELPAALWHDLLQLVTIRRGNQHARPLLAPEQSYFLRQNLELKLETARLALLRGNAPVYQRAMLEAADWIRTYYDAGNSATEQVLNDIAQLGSADIQPTLPDISGSLRTLRRITARLGVNAPKAGTAAPRVTIHPAPAKGATKPKSQAAPTSKPKADKGAAAKPKAQAAPTPKPGVNEGTAPAKPAATPTQGPQS